MSFTGTALQTNQAKQAYGVGIVTLVLTWDLNKAITATFQEAKRNGAWQTTKFAFGLDILAGIITAIRR